MTTNICSGICSVCGSKMKLEETDRSPDDNSYEIWYCPRCRSLKTWGVDQ